MLAQLLLLYLHIPRVLSSPAQVNGVPHAQREHWMRVANAAVYAGPDAHPCPFSPFGTAIVNTTSNDLVCVAANQIANTGDITRHGEITAIRACTAVLARRGLSPGEIHGAWQELSLYTNGEPCPMCATAIRWAGFRDVTYGTSEETLRKYGIDGIYVPWESIWSGSEQFPHKTERVVDVLREETDPWFAYQRAGGACPVGCERVGGGDCEPVDNWRELVEAAGHGAALKREAPARDEL